MNKNKKIYNDGQTYWISGKLLNEITEELKTSRILQGEGIEIMRVPGKGTTVSATIYSEDQLGGGGGMTGGTIDLTICVDGVLKTAKVYGSIEEEP